MHIYVFDAFTFYFANCFFGTSSRILHVCIEIWFFSGGISFYFQGDDQLIERLAGLDGIITEGNNLKEESGKNRVRVLAEVSLQFFCYPLVETL